MGLYGVLWRVYGSVQGFSGVQGLGLLRAYLAPVLFSGQPRVELHRFLFLFFLGFRVQRLI